MNDEYYKSLVGAIISDMITIVENDIPPQETYEHLTNNIAKWIQVVTQTKHERITNGNLIHSR